MSLRAALQVVTVDTTTSFDRVYGYTYVDRMCDLFELTVEVGSDDPAMSVTPHVRSVADFRSGEEATPLCIRGVVKSVEQVSAEPGGASRYRFVVVPELWVLTLNRQRRIFQEQSVIETVIRLLAENAATSTVQLEPSLMELHDVVQYRTQYDESDFSFLRRILLEEGFVFFVGRKSSEAEGAIEPVSQPALVLFDDSTKVDVTLELPYEPLAEGAMASGGGLRARRFSPGAVGVPEGAVTRDYDHLRPSLLLEGEASRLVTNARRDSEVFQFAVEAPPGDMTIRAARFLEAHQAPTGRAILAATATLLPGTGIKLTGHPTGDQELLVIGVRTEVSQSERSKAVRRSHQIEAVAKRIRIRRSPEAPPRAGLQSATVVGNGEVDVDAEGRVIVRFPWDRRSEEERDPKQSTRRVRVSQSWAGPGYGFMTLPRVGDEVLISFLDDDPDSPVVMGRLYNGQNLPQLTLPAQQTRSSWKSLSTPGGKLFNEILFEDLAGSELLSVHAGRDMERATGRDESHTVGRDFTTQVDGKKVEVVAKGVETKVTGGSSTNVQGGSRFDVEPDLRLKSTEIAITGTDVIRLSTSQAFLNANCFYVDTPEVTQVNAGHFHVFAKHNIRLHCGGASIKLEGGNIEIRAPGDIIINGALVKLNCD